MPQNGTWETPNICSLLISNVHRTPPPYTIKIKYTY
nr:MAG TPA: hypothetical protein [Caudoviricetes sp.]